MRVVTLGQISQEPENLATAVRVKGQDVLLLPPAGGQACPFT